MKLLKIVLFTFITTTGFINAQAQTADEIINKYIGAMGGMEKVSQIKTVYIDGEMDIMGNKAPSLTYIVNGKGYKNEVDFNGSKIISVYTDKGGWTVNPMAGQSTPTPAAEELLPVGQLNFDLAGPLVDYAKKGNKVELLEKEGNNYKLKVTTAKNVESTFFIDATTYYNVKITTKMNMNGQEVEIVNENSDFRKTDNGFLMYYAGAITYPGLTINYVNNKIEINKDIDMAIFEMPKN